MASNSICDLEGHAVPMCHVDGCLWIGIVGAIRAGTDRPVEMCPERRMVLTGRQYFPAVRAISKSLTIDYVYGSGMGSHIVETYGISNM